MTIQRLTQRFIAEIVGTYILVFIHAGLAIATAFFLGPYDLPTRLNVAGLGLGVGLSLIGLIYTFGDISGAHFNPNVTLAFFLRGVFPFHLVLLYLVAEIIGGYLAASTLYGIFGTSVDNMGSNRARGISLFPNAFILEMILTAILILTILRVNNRGYLVGPQVALAVGFTIVYLTLLGATFGVGSMNSIRTLSIATFSGLLVTAGILISAQLLGVVIAVLLSYALDVKTPERMADERKLVKGDAPENSSSRL